ncbi:MAG: hypothetical protein N3E38_01485 [Candidatus Aenigmarchaeota archaeon]|nr:hypothetical protein [Candidatus Aenigmarchaeota archaeon]
MSDEIFYVITSIIIGILIFFVVYKLIMVSIKYIQNENVLKDFEDFHSNIEYLCRAGPGNGVGISYEMPNSVKVIYATDFVSEYDYVSNFVDTIIFSRGKNVCLFFKDEDEPRCKKTSCEVIMPYLGTLDYQNDFQLLVNKILGKKLVKKYNIFLQNIAGDILITKDRYVDPSEINFDIRYKDYVIVFLQLNGEINNFQQIVDAIVSNWAEKTPLKNCNDKVKAIVVNEICHVPNQEGVCRGDGKTYYQTFYNMIDCANKASLGFYKRIVGVLNQQDICSINGGVVKGYTLGYGSPVIVANGEIEMAIHELGHTYGLCDEGYGSACDERCESGYSLSGGADCEEKSDICCPNYPEFNSIYCTAFGENCYDCTDTNKQRQCSYAFNFASSSYNHLEEELGEYCGG